MARLLPVHVVDDDEAVRSSFQSLLGALGFRVEAFASGEEFLVKQRDLNPGILIIDWRMPGCGGVGVLRKLRAGFVPIVHSASLDSGTIAEARKLGAAATIEKPCIPFELVETVKALAIVDED